MKRLILIVLALLVSGCAAYPPAGLETDADVYYKRGEAWSMKGDYKQAISNYDKAIEINPIFVLAYNSRGNAYRHKGQYERAISDYSMAIQIDPRYAGAYYNRARVYLDRGQYERAISDYNKAIEINPGHAPAHNNRGNAYFDKGQYDQAISDYNKAIEIKSKDAGVYYNRGNAYKRKGQYEQAISDYNKAIEINSKYSAARNSLAWILATCADERYRDGKRAIILAKQALESNADPAVMDTLAAAYAEAGMFADAVRTQEEAIALLREKVSADNMMSEAHIRLEFYGKRLEFYRARKAWQEE